MDKYKSATQMGFTNLSRILNIFQLKNIRFLAVKLRYQYIRKRPLVENKKKKQNTSYIFLQSIKFIILGGTRNRKGDLRSTVYYSSNRTLLIRRFKVHKSV